MKRATAEAAEIPHITVTAHGDVPDEIAAYARDRLLALAGNRAEPVSFIGVKLIRDAGETGGEARRRTIAQATLDMGGRLVRAQVADRSPRAAVDLLTDRLRARLELLDRDHGAPRRSSRSTPEGTGVGYADLAPEQRKIVRRKSYAMATETPDEAAFELEIMDYGFRLFTDRETGQDSVIYRGAAGDYLLAQVTPTPLRSPARIRLTASTNAAPRLTEDEARRMLEEGGGPFVFFADPGSGRGRVLYRRHDGHYGVITPA